MRITNITINNFQSYYGEQSIDFGKGLNLIIGKGGKGKSKLFNAFYWVLFGKIYISEIGWRSTDGLPSNANFALKRHEYINKKALKLTIKACHTRLNVVHLLKDFNLMNGTMNEPGK